tara:strand:+ start:51 stop:314 length:264 start_codon:yes stop_codon:yes gene_type:complete
LNIKDQASKIRQLQNDSVFQEVMQAIRDKQVGLFLNPEVSQDVLVDAHDIIRALGNIETYFNSVLTDEAFFDKQQKESVPWNKRLRM